MSREINFNILKIKVNNERMDSILQNKNLSVHI